MYSIEDRGGGKPGRGARQATAWPRSDLDPELKQLIKEYRMQLKYEPSGLLRHKELHFLPRQRRKLEGRTSSKRCFGVVSLRFYLPVCRPSGLRTAARIDAAGLLERASGDSDRGDGEAFQL